MTDSVEHAVNELDTEHIKMMKEMTAQHNAMINMTLVSNIEIQQYLLILIFINFVMIVMIAIAYYPPYKKIEIKPEGYKPLPDF